MSFYEEAVKSNTTWQPRDHLVDADTDIESIVYFNLSDKSVTALQDRLTKSTVKTETKDYYNEMIAMCPIWKFLLNSFVENHSEAFSLDKGLSDSFTVMSTGTNTIKIMMSGVLQAFKEFDYRLDFLYIYDKFFRGYTLENNNFELQVTMENTVFFFKPFGLQYAQDPSVPDYIRLSMTGLGYNYSVIDDGSISLRRITGL